MAAHRRTRPHRPLLAALLALVLALAATPASAERPGPPTSPAATREGFLRSTIARMTLEEKVGQLFATWAFGTSADDATYAAANRARYGVDTPGEVVARYHLGGVLYFVWAHNTRSPVQITELSNSLQRVALDQPSGIPLFLTIDQETGIVNRMNAPATEFPGNMALGATRSAELARGVWRIVGEELDAVGVTMDFAPVLDVNTNPLNPVIGLRSFGQDPTLVGELGAAAVAALQSTGVSATIKHFPGHGDTAVDSHYGLPLVDYDRQTLMDVHVAPFRQAIGAGADAVMTAHMVVEAVDPDLPSTVSRKVLTGLLRDELGFEGLIVTDALDMAALAAFWPQDEIAVMALEAGADVLLMPSDLPLAYAGVLEAVRSGRLSVQRIEESVRRILEVKLDRGLFADPFADPAQVAARVGTPEHLAFADEVARRAVTLVRDDAAVLPATGAQDVLVVGPSAANTAALAGRLGEHDRRVSLQTVSTSPTAAQRAAAVAAAPAADLVVVATTNARGSSAQRQLVADLAATGTPVVVVAASLPYDVAHVPAADAVLATYSNRPVAMRAAADVLVGAAAPQGRLPVTVPAPGGGVAYPYGHGLGW